MVGDLESFDADANLYWVSSIASAWSPDAKLYFIRVTRPSPGGTVDLSAKGLGGVLYQFNSSSRGDVDFNVDVGSLRGQRKPPLSVSTSKHADGTPRNAIAKPKCTLVSALAKARAGVLATADPKYGLDFTLESDGANTSWTTTAVLAGKSQWVRIDATKCEVEKRDAGK
jgi:hypothetical protein